MLRDGLFLILGIIFFIIWLIAFLAFHIAGGFIHLLIVIAVIAIVIHFVRGRGTSV